MRKTTGHLLTLMLTLALLGCGGGQGLRSSFEGDQTEPATTTTGTGTIGNSQPPGESLGEQIKQLEQTGRLPVLDRSTDVAGPDQDGDQVRDDIQAWINAQSLTEPRKRAAFQLARAFQKTLLIDASDATMREAARKGVSEASHCVSLMFKGEFAKGDQLGSQLEAMTANTRERARRYTRYNAALSGYGWKLPNGDTCQ